MHDQRNIKKKYLGSLHAWEADR